MGADIVKFDRAARFHPAAAAIAERGAARGWHRFTKVSRRGWTITGGLESNGINLPVVILGASYDGAPLAQYLPLSPERVRWMHRALCSALAEDDGAAEFLMVDGIPFDSEEVMALASVLTALLAAIDGGLQ